MKAALKNGLVVLVLCTVALFMQAKGDERLQLSVKFLDRTRAELRLENHCSHPVEFYDTITKRHFGIPYAIGVELRDSKMQLLQGEGLVAATPARWQATHVPMVRYPYTPTTVWPVKLNTIETGQEMVVEIEISDLFKRVEKATLAKGKMVNVTCRIYLDERLETFIEADTGWTNLPVTR